MPTRIYQFGTDEPTLRFTHLGSSCTIMVNSIEPFLKRLKEHRVKFLGDTPTTLSNGNQFVLIQDPDGIFIELIGPE